MNQKTILKSFLFLFLLVLSMTSILAIEDTNLYAYYNFDTDSTDSFSTHDGTDTSMSYTSAQINNGANFNGVSSKIVLNSINLDNGGKAFNMWISTATSATTYILDNNDVERFIIGTNGGTWQTYDGTAWRDTGYSSTSAGLKMLTWVYKDGGGLDFYVNGVIYTSSMTFNPTSLSNLNALGSVVTGSGSYYNGILDELSIWNDVLTSSEILELYNSGNGITYPFQPPTTETQITKDLVTSNANWTNVGWAGFNEYAYVDGTQAFYEYWLQYENPIVDAVLVKWQPSINTDDHSYFGLESGTTGLHYKNSYQVNTNANGDTLYVSEYDDSDTLIYSEATGISYTQQIYSWKIMPDTVKGAKYYWKAEGSDESNSITDSGWTLIYDSTPTGNNNGRLRGTSELKAKVVNRNGNKPLLHRVYYLEAHEEVNITIDNTLNNFSTIKTGNYNFNTPIEISDTWGIVNSITFENDIISTEPFYFASSLTSYGSNSISTTATCRITIDGVSVTQTSRTITPTKYGNIPLVSPADNLTLGNHTINTECLRSGTPSNNLDYTIYNSQLSEFLLYDSLSNSTITHLTFDNSEPIIIDSQFEIADSYSNSNIDSQTSNVITSQWSEGQSFTGNNEILSKASTYLWKTGTVTGTIRAELYGHNPADPDVLGGDLGSPLAISTNTINIADYDDTYQKITFDFNETYLLNSTSDNYFISFNATLTAPTSTGNLFGYGADSSSPTHTGLYYYFHEASNRFIYISSKDMAFEIQTSDESLGSFEFTTANTTGTTNKNFLVTQGTVSYNYDVDSDITAYFRIEETGETCGDYTRGGLIGQIGNVGASCLFSNLESETTYNLSLYAYTSTGTGSLSDLTSNLYVIQINDTAGAVTKLEIETPLTPATLTKIATINIANHLGGEYNVFSEASIMVNSSVEQDAYFYLSNDVSTSSFYRTINSNTGNIVIQNVFEESGIETKEVNLYGYCPSGCGIVGGTLDAFVSDASTVSTGNFDIIAYNIWDNSPLTSFSAKIGGSTFSTTNGTISAFAQGTTDVVLSATDYTSYTHSHDTTIDLNGSIYQSEVKIESTGIYFNRSIQNFSIETENGIANSTNGTIYLYPSYNTYLWNFTNYENYFNQSDLTFVVNSSSHNNTIVNMYSHTLDFYNSITNETQESSCVYNEDQEINNTFNKLDYHLDINSLICTNFGFVTNNVTLESKAQNVEVYIEPVQLLIEFSEVTSGTVTWSGFVNGSEGFSFNSKYISKKQNEIGEGQITIVYNNGTQLFQYDNDYNSHINQYLQVNTPTFIQPIKLWNGAIFLEGRVSAYKYENNTFVNIYSAFTSTEGQALILLEDGAVYKFTGEAEGYDTLSQQVYIPLSSDTQANEIIYLKLVETVSTQTDIPKMSTTCDTVIKNTTVCTITIDSLTNAYNLRFDVEGNSTYTETYAESTSATLVITINNDTVKNNKIIVDGYKDGEYISTITFNWKGESTDENKIGLISSMRETVRQNPIPYIIMVLITSIIIGYFTKLKFEGQEFNVVILWITAMGIMMPILYAVGLIYILWIIYDGAKNTGD